MSNRNKIQLIIVTSACFLSYLLFGLFDSMKGPTLPAILDDVGFSYSVGGTIIMGQYGGYFAATILAGIMTDYWGPKITLIVAGICLVSGVIGYSLSSQMLFLLVFIFFIGFGLGALELCGCNIIADIYQEKKARYLNILTAIAGFGAIMSPLGAGYLLDQGFSWRMVYRFGLLVAIPIIVFFFIIKYPFYARPKSPMENSQKAVSSKVWYRKELLLMYILNFSYMAAEIGIATWMTDFYRNVKHLSMVQSSAYLSLFFVCITLGRILGSLFVDKIGHAKSVLTASFCAVVCILLGVMGPGKLCILLSFTGFFYSIIFPTGSAMVSEISPHNTGRVLGIHFACGGLGGMVGPWLLGIANDVIGLQWGMALNALFFVGIIIPVMMLKQYPRARNGGL